MTGLIFSTVHGSHLYGLAHEGSDLDVYEVYEGKADNLRPYCAAATRMHYMEMIF